MEKALNELKDTGNFEKFAKDTREDWVKLARYLLGRWEGPAAVELDDIVQELLFHCWRVLPKYDPTRGVSLRRYVVWNSCDYAKRWLHDQRGAYRRSDKSESRFPIAFSNHGEKDFHEIAWECEQYALVSTYEAIEVRVKNKPKVREAIECLFAGAFDNAVAIDKMVSRGYSKCAAQKHVSRAVQELKAAI